MKNLKRFNLEECLLTPDAEEFSQNIENFEEESSLLTTDVDMTQEIASNEFGDNYNESYFETTKNSEENLTVQDSNQKRKKNFAEQLRAINVKNNTLLHQLSADIKEAVLMKNVTSYKLQLNELNEVNPIMIKNALETEGLEVVLNENDMLIRW